MNADGPAGTPTSSLGSGTVPNLRLTPNSPVALLIIDVQNAIDDPSWGQRNNLQAEHNIGQLLTAWRTNGLPVIHVRHDSTQPESPYRLGQPGNAFKTEVAPRPDETIIAKSTNSAFIGTDLEAFLRNAAINLLVITGVITNNSVEATVRMAGNLGFEAYVISDATATVDKTDLNGRLWTADEVQALSLANMAGQYASVLTTEEVLNRLAETA